MPHRAIKRIARKQDRKTAAFERIGYNWPTTDFGRFTTPDHNSLDATGRLSLIALTTVHTNESSVMIGKGQGFTTYGMGGTGLGNTTLGFGWRNGGINQAASSSAGIVVLDTPRWYRVDFEPVAGTSDALIYWRYSDDSVFADPLGINWTTHNISGETGLGSIDVSTHVGVCGGRNDDTRFVRGKVHCAAIIVDGTLVANPDFRDRTQYTSNTSLTDSTGKVWSAAGVATWALPKQTGFARPTLYSASFPNPIPQRRQVVRG